MPSSGTGSRQTNTFQEWLPKLAIFIAQGKQLEDAPLYADWITSLETAVLDKMHEPIDNTTSPQPGGGPPLSNVPAPGPADAGNPMAAMMAGGPGGPPPPPGPPPGGPGGPMQGASMPNPDELRRVLGLAGQ